MLLGLTFGPRETENQHDLKLSDGRITECLHVADMPLRSSGECFLWILPPQGVGIVATLFLEWLLSRKLSQCNLVSMVMIVDRERDLSQFEQGYCYGKMG